MTATHKIATRELDLIGFCDVIVGLEPTTIEALYSGRNATYFLVRTVTAKPPTAREIDPEDAWKWLLDHGFDAEASELAEIGT